MLDNSTIEDQRNVRDCIVYKGEQRNDGDVHSDIKLSILVIQGDLFWNFL